MEEEETPLALEGNKGNKGNKENSANKKWIISTVILAFLSVFFFFLALAFFLVWLFSRDSGGTTNGGTTNGGTTNGGTGCLPSAPSDNLGSYMAASGACIKPASTPQLDVVPFTLVNQSDQSVQLFYIKATTKCSSAECIDQASQTVVASPVIQPGKGYSLGIYLQAYLSVYTYGEDNIGVTVPVSSNGQATGGDSFYPPITVPVSGVVTGSGGNYSVNFTF